MQVNKQQLELDVEQTASKLGKKYVKVVYFLPAHFTYMQSALCEILGWMNHKLENISKFRYAYDTTLMAKSKEELKSLLMKVKEENEVAGLNFNI